MLPLSSQQPRYLLLGCTTLIFVSLFYLSGLSWSWNSSSCKVSSASLDAHDPVATVNPPHSKPFERALEHSEPQKSFRDNLRNDTHYITSWATAGMTNEFIGYMNLIYLGLLTERVPIVPPFLPHDHMTWAAGPLPFGSVFNLDLLRDRLRRPILEWSDVKGLPDFDYSSQDYDKIYRNPNVDAIGCWCTRRRSDTRPAFTLLTERFLGLDISYTRVPDYTRLNPEGDDPFIKFHWLSASIMAGHPREPSNVYPLMTTSPLNGTVHPNEHLACYDDLFYATSGVDELDWRFTWSPAWRTVGTHLPFSNHLLDLAKGYLRRALGVPQDQAIPPLITIHIRHGDFGNQCSQPPCIIGVTERYSTAVADIQHRLLEERGIDNARVFVASDDETPEFWNDVSSLGWVHVNHTAERTIELYNEWYPPLIDTAILSFGIGFVGTDTSSFSTLGAWRVMDWNKGITVLVPRDQ